MKKSVYVYEAIQVNNNQIVLDKLCQNVKKSIDLLAFLFYQGDLFSGDEKII